MIRPVLQDDEFLADVRTTTEPALWWLGQSGFLLHWDRHYALLDPYLSDSLSRKYAGTDKPHVRMTERVVDPAKLDFVQVVTSSHNHTDHLDAETLLPLRTANPALQMVIPEANREFVAHRLSCDEAWPLGLNAGQSRTVGPFQFHALASAHEQLDPDSQGLFPYLGYIVEVDGLRIYHSGDTVLCDGLDKKLKALSPDVALLPINGSLPERKVAGNLWGSEAAWLARQADIPLTVPCHYEMFEFNTVTPEEFVGEAQRLGIGYKLLRNGERLPLR